jgi:hypothetical protein
MARSDRARRLATAAELLAPPETSRFHEVIAAERVRMADRPLGEGSGLDRRIAAVFAGTIAKLSLQ